MWISRKRIKEIENISDNALRIAVLATINREETKKFLQKSMPNTWRDGEALLRSIQIDNYMNDIGSVKKYD